MDARLSEIWHGCVTTMTVKGGGTRPERPRDRRAVAWQLGIPQSGRDLSWPGVAVICYVSRSYVSC